MEGIKMAGKEGMGRKGMEWQGNGEKWYGKYRTRAVLRKKLVPFGQMAE